MLEAGGGEVNQVLVLYGVAFGPHLSNYFLHTDGVPRDHGVGEQIQTAHDLLLSLLLFAAQHAAAVESEPATQRVQMLSA